MAQMTMRTRMLALIQGREHDRVPFVQYRNLAAPDEEVWAVVGRENMGVVEWTTVHGVASPHCHFETEEIVRDGKKGFRRTLYTPEGHLFEERLYEPAFGTSAAAAHFVKEPSDYRILVAYFRDMEIHKNRSHFDAVVRAIGDDGLPHTAVARTPFQQLWINFPSSVHLAPPEEVYRATREILEQGGHSGRLQIQISENMPPGVWRRSFPQIVKAIADFGPVSG